MSNNKQIKDKVDRYKDLCTKSTSVPLECLIKYGQFKIKNRINGQKWAKMPKLKNFTSAFGTPSFSCL